MSSGSSRSRTQPVTATRESWKTVPFAEGIPLPYSARFSAAQYELLRRGLVPKEMEDKWFIYFEAQYLYFHRSWTGQPAYRVKVETPGASAVVTEALLDASLGERPPEERAHHAKLVDFLVSNLLLGQQKPFPLPEGETGQDGILQHGFSGTGYAEDAAGGQQGVEAPGESRSADREEPQGEYVATLIHDTDYAAQVGQVATVWTRQLLFVRRKELALQPYALEFIPMSRVRAIHYDVTWAWAPAVVGAVCVVIAVAAMVMPVSEALRMPVGALALAAGAGVIWMRGIKRHLLEFSLGDRTVRWRSKAGEFKDREFVVQKVVDFARTAGLLRSSVARSR